MGIGLMKDNPVMASVPARMGTPAAWRRDTDVRAAVQFPGFWERGGAWNWGRRVRPMFRVGVMCWP